MSLLRCRSAARRVLWRASSSIAAASRPWRVLGLQQVAIGGLDKGKLSALWEGVLGVPKVGSYVSEKENVDEDILRLGQGPLSIEIDLMQPLDPSRAPKVHVPPLNHIGLWVRRLSAESHIHPHANARTHARTHAGRWTQSRWRSRASRLKGCALHLAASVRRSP